MLSTESTEAAQNADASSPRLSPSHLILTSAMATTSQQQREIDHATELGSLSLLQYPQPLIVQGRFSLLPALCTFYTTFLLYPSLFTFFVTVSIVLSIFSALGGGAILNWLSVTYARNPVAPGDGFSLTNWVSSVDRPLASIVVDSLAVDRSRRLQLVQHAEQPRCRSLHALGPT